MTRAEMAAEAWQAWTKDKPPQSEDTAKGFIEGFNLCLLGKIKVEGGDKGELISANFYLQDRLLDLERQIEKMKNFENCAYQLHIEDCPIFKSDGHISCKECPHWILQEVSK